VFRLPDKVRVDPVSSAITRVLICQFGGVANHAIFDPLLPGRGRLEGQAVRYMAVDCKKSVVAVFRGWQSVDGYGETLVIKRGHGAHSTSNCRKNGS